MPYRVNDQLSVSLSIDDVDLSDHHENVLNVNIVEQAGTELPIVSMVVRTKNRRVPLLINEGNPLDIEISDDKQKTSPVSAGFLLQRPSLTRSGADSWLVSSNGIKNTFPQWAKSRVETSASKSGVERILEVARRAEGTVLDVPGSVRSSRDKQNWVQYGCPDKVHVDEIWMHCDLGDSFPLMASTLEGFVIVDVGKLSQGTPSTDSAIRMRVDALCTICPPAWSILRDSSPVSAHGGRSSRSMIYRPDREAWWNPNLSSTCPGALRSRTISTRWRTQEGH